MHWDVSMWKWIQVKCQSRTSCKNRDSKRNCNDPTPWLRHCCVNELCHGVKPQVWVYLNHSWTEVFCLSGGSAFSALCWCTPSNNPLQTTNTSPHIPPAHMLNFLAFYVSILSHAVAKFLIKLYIWGCSGMHTTTLHPFKQRCNTKQKQTSPTFHWPIDC